MTLSTIAVISAGLTGSPWLWSLASWRCSSGLLGMPGITPPPSAASSEGPEDRGELLLQGLGVEWLDDVIRHPGFLGGDDVLGLAFRRDHDERNVGELGVRPDLFQQLEPGHRLHVPVRDHQTEVLLAQPLQRGRAVGSLVDIV